MTIVFRKDDQQQDTYLACLPRLYPKLVEFLSKRGYEPTLIDFEHRQAIRISKPINNFLTFVDGWEKFSGYDILLKRLLAIERKPLTKTQNRRK